MAKSRIEADININNKDAINSLNKLSRSLDDFGKNASSSFSTAKSAFASFSGNIAALAVSGAFKAIGAGIQTLNDNIGEFINLASVQEDAVNELNTSLALTGKFSAESSKDLQQFASELQSVSTVGDEATLQNAALIQSIANLETEGLKKATLAATDLSAALGIDLRTSSQLVARAAEGDVGAFKRYGIEIEKGATKAETFENALTSLNNQFGGAATSKLQTFSGASTALGNAFGDLKESIGAIITQNPVVIKAIQIFQGLFERLTASVSNNKSVITNFLNTAIVNLIKGFNTALELVLPFARFFETTFIIALNTAKAAISGFLAASTAAWTATLSGIEGVAGLIGVSVEKVTAARESFQTLRDGFAETAVESSGKIKAAFTEENTVLEESGLKLLEFTQGLEESLTREAELIDTNKNAFLEGLNAKNMGRQEELASEKKLSEAKKKIAISDMKFSELSNRSKLEQTSKTLGLVTQLTAQGGKDTFEINKAAALASAVVEGVLGVQKALSSAPPPLNFVNAALVGALAAVNVGKIASSKPPAFQEGGIVPGTSFSGDNVPVLANSGELILNRAQQNTVASQLVSQDSQVVDAINNLRSELGGQNISVEVDGRTIASVVRNEIQSGFSLGVA